MPYRRPPSTFSLPAGPRRRYGSLSILMLAVALAGCAGSPIAQMRENIAYEETKNVVPVRYKDDLPAFFRTYLNDPTGIRDGAISQPTLLKVDDIDRYVACVRYNPKKSSGQYAGLETGAAVYVSGRLDRLISLRREGAGTGASNNAHRKNLQDYCATAAYQPLPELSTISR